MKRYDGEAQQASSLDGVFALLCSKEQRWAATGICIGGGNACPRSDQSSNGCLRRERLLGAQRAVLGDGGNRRTAGIVLSAGCIPLALYCAGMVFAGWGSNAHYDNIAGITVATTAFADLGLAISGIVSAQYLTRGQVIRHLPAALPRG